MQVKNEWGMFEDNLFNANHRNAMLRIYGYTLAKHLTIAEIIEEFRLRKLYEGVV